MGGDDSLPASVYHTLYFPPDPPSYIRLTAGTGDLTISLCLSASAQFCHDFYPHLSTGGELSWHVQIREIKARLAER